MLIKFRESFSVMDLGFGEDIIKTQSLPLRGSWLGWCCGVMALGPVRLTSPRSASLSHDCSASLPANAAENAPEPELLPSTGEVILGGSPGAWLTSGSTLPFAGIWGLKQQVKDPSLYLFLLLVVTLLFKLTIKKKIVSILKNNPAKH